MKGLQQQSCSRLRALVTDSLDGIPGRGHLRDPPNWVATSPNIRSPKPEQKPVNCDEPKTAAGRRGSSVHGGAERPLRGTEDVAGGRYCVALDFSSSWRHSGFILLRFPTDVQASRRMWDRYSASCRAHLGCVEEATFSFLSFFRN